MFVKVVSGGRKFYSRPLHAVIFAVETYCRSKIWVAPASPDEISGWRTDPLRARRRVEIIKQCIKRWTLKIKKGSSLGGKNPRWGRVGKPGHADLLSGSGGAAVSSEARWPVFHGMTL
jgi:hypothetical protein